MKSFIKNSAVEICVFLGIIALCIVCHLLIKESTEYKDLYKLEHYKFEQAQKAFDSLQIEKTELLRSAAIHVNSADSALALMTAKGKEKLKLIQQYENNNNTIDNWTSSQLDSAFSVN